MLFGTCDEELALPYQPWVHALDHLLRSLPGFGRPIISDRDLGDLLVLLPQLERLLPGLLRPAPADPETERYLLFSAVDRVLASSARHTPLLVLLDDVHWAGRQTLELLRHLVRSGSASGLMIIATFRDSAAELSDPLAEALVDLQRSESVSRIRLGGLDTASVEQFVSAALDQELDPDLRDLAAAAADTQRRQRLLPRRVVEASAAPRCRHPRRRPLGGAPRCRDRRGPRLRQGRGRRPNGASVAARPPTARARGRCGTASGVPGAVTGRRDECRRCQRRARRARRQWVPRQCRRSSADVSVRPCARA